MVRPVLVLVLLAAGAAAVRLGRTAAAGWREQAAGEAYDLPADRRGPLRHAAGAAVAALCALALLAALADGAGGGGGGATAAAGPAAAEAPGDALRAHGGPPPAAPPADTSASAFTTVGSPAGGSLLQGTLPAADGGRRTVHVWLPPQYAEDDRTRFPVVVLQPDTPGRTADAGAPYLFDGFADAVRQHRAVPFVVVAPQAPPGTGHPCDLLAAAPEAVPDDAVLRSAVAARFRTLRPGPRGWETLGVGGGAPCAAAAGLARPDLYGAAAALTGRYAAAVLARTAADGRPGPEAPRLLLAAARRDTAGRAAARALRDALHAAGGRAAGARVRVSEVVRDFAPDRERLRLVRVAVQYLAEALPGEARPARGPRVR
ncbi:hypothetical protein LO771_08525 [Streptacidiphilus sp. ASG 303]|uniref:hypothetical protein n=1 Tax=Streptacidiphilus sp. ASG 303 TaxID=2896847 RepID=UPI001E56EB9D|nr:hypothetical protein [Streptacidiphilus sp. ASG 303]MCD0482445.1 hypothetical protein [Streptacidiphilus sp. ASG 303]